jgi:mannose-1-phosphate guanylyltransferase/mannose-6-phosphate isomerase
MVKNLCALHYTGTMFNDCIIMAGGSGTRLWPASNSKIPKQFLSLTGEETFFNAAVERALNVIEKDGRVIIIAGEAHVSHVIRTCARYGPDIKKRLLLIPEPEPMNTAPAIACGVYYAGLDGGDRTVLVLTSDHVIRPLERFKADAAAAAGAAAAENLAIFGIPPLGPEIGYGYIETGDTLPAPGGAAVRKVLSFREKPDRALAEKYLSLGNFYWNSGMFGFSVLFMTGEFRRNAPDSFSPFEKLLPPTPESYALEEGVPVLRNWRGLREAYRAVRSISFDYAIAEKCGNTVMVAASFDWFDVGSWDEYARLSGDRGSEVYNSGSASCFVDADIPVALCGVEDLIVTVRSGKDGSPQAVLIAKKGETQRVRDIVEQIKAAGRKDLL